jgi:hypothetical protein
MFIDPGLRMRWKAPKERNVSAQLMRTLEETCRSYRAPVIDCPTNYKHHAPLELRNRLGIACDWLARSILQLNYASNN